jgi:hypothetical protein
VTRQRSGLIVTAWRSREDVGKFRQAGEDVERAQTRNRAPDEVVGQQVAKARNRLDKVVAVPEGRPWNQDEQKSCFEKQSD